jgi:hypothetical protein
MDAIGDRDRGSKLAPGRMACSYMNRMCLGFRLEAARTMVRSTWAGTDEIFRPPYHQRGPCLTSKSVPGKDLWYSSPTSSCEKAGNLIPASPALPSESHPTIEQDRGAKRVRYQVFGK